jgi:hypothetical protein
MSLMPKAQTTAALLKYFKMAERFSLSRMSLSSKCLTLMLGLEVGLFHAAGVEDGASALYFASACILGLGFGKTDESIVNANEALFNGLEASRLRLFRRVRGLFRRMTGRQREAPIDAYEARGALNGYIRQLFTHHTLDDTLLAGAISAISCYALGDRGATVVTSAISNIAGVIVGSAARRRIIHRAQMPEALVKVFN